MVHLRRTSCLIVTFEGREILLTLNFIHQNPKNGDYPNPLISGRFRRSGDLRWACSWYCDGRFILCTERLPGRLHKSLTLRRLDRRNHQKGWKIEKNCFHSWTPIFQRYLMLIYYWIFSQVIFVT